MHIKAKFFASLRNNYGKDAIYDLKDGSTVSDLFKEMRLPVTITKIVLVNGKSVEGNMSYKLADNDVLSIFPPIGGG